MPDSTTPDTADEATDDTPDAVKLSRVQKFYQNREFAKIRESGRNDARVLSKNFAQMQRVLQRKAELPTDHDLPEKIVTDADHQEDVFIRISEASQAPLQGAVRSLRELSSEHQRPENQSHAWFHGNDSSAESGKQRYTAIRRTIVTELGRLSDDLGRCRMEGVDELHEAVDALETKSKAVISRDGDFEGGHSSLAEFCDEVDSLITRFTKKCQEIEDKREREDKDLHEKIQKIREERARYITEPDLLDDLRKSADAVSTTLNRMNDNKFWSDEAFSSSSGEPILATATDIKAKLVRMQDARVDTTEVQDIASQLEELAQKMSDQIAEQTERPADVLVDPNASKVRMTVNLMTDAFRSRYRNAVFASTLLVATAGTLLLRNSGTSDQEPQSQVSASNTSPQANPPAATTSPSQPSVAPEIGKVNLGLGRVEVQGDNFVFQLDASVRAAQVWVGEGGKNPVRLTLNIANGQATAQIPADLKNAPWLGVQLDTFTSGAWQKGVFQKLVLK